MKSPETQEPGRATKAEIPRRIGWGGVAEDTSWGRIQESPVLMT